MKAQHGLNSLRLMIVLFGIALASQSGALAQECNGEARRWVMEQGVKLPRTYDGISQFPLNYRKAIYATLGPETRSLLWQQHLELYLAENSDNLSEAQRDALLEAIQLTTPDTFRMAKDKDNRRYRQIQQRVSAFEERARAAFGAEAGAIFATLGPSGEVVPGQRSIQQKYVTPYCNCSDQSDYCDDWGRGVCNLGGCVKRPEECGTLWIFDCDGLCGSVEAIE